MTSLGSSIVDSSNQSLIDELDEAQQQRLAKLLDEYVLQLQLGEQPSVAEIAAAHPDLERPLRAYLPSLHLLQNAAVDAQSEGQASLAVAWSVDEPLGDFELGREIGRGGMGIVYEARQISLSRRVAIKVLPFAAILDQRQIARFQNEARAVAQLQHSNIVPVYAVGCERGVHFFAMQFIDGTPLDRLIRERQRLLAVEETTSRDGIPEVSHTGRTSESVGSTLTQTEQRTDGPGIMSVAQGKDGCLCGDAIDQAVASIIPAAEALQHAHSNGIVHRDIKPSNLLLDHEGKIWVTDFGLAHVPAAAGATLTGDVMGTARYMSPEQAAGPLHAVDFRTDIYSLGVTLYELLTLQDAYAGADRQEFLRRIEQEELKRPRHCNRNIAPDLENVILKATSKSRAARYQSAQEFADDLGRYLAGEPTLARQPNWFVRAARRVQKHRRAVASVLVGFCTTVGLAVATLLVLQAESGKEAAVNEKWQSFYNAREAFDDLGPPIATELDRVPGAAAVQQRLLLEWLSYYRAFLLQAGQDPDRQHDVAATYVRIGRLLERTGTTVEALQAFTKARDIYQALVTEAPGKVSFHLRLAECHNKRGQLLSQCGETAAAFQAYRRSIDRYRESIATFRDAHAESGLALALCNLGALHGECGQALQARETLLQAIAIQEQQLDGDPDNVALGRQLAVSRHNLAYLLASTDPAAALRHSLAARDHQQQLLANRDLPSLQQAELESQLALSHNNLGTIVSSMGDYQQATVHYRAAVEVASRLVANHGAVPAYHRDLAVSYNNLGRVLGRDGRPREAVVCFRKARRLVADLLQHEPENPNYQSVQGGVLNNLGTTLVELEKLDEALNVYREGLDYQQSALEAAPQITRTRAFLARQFQNYAIALRSAGRHSEAAEAIGTSEKWLATSGEPLGNTDQHSMRDVQPVVMTRWEKINNE